MTFLTKKSLSSKIALFVCASLAAPFALAIQCVPYAKDQRPGGYDWNGLFPIIKNGKPMTTSCKAADEGKTCARWYAGKELGNSLYAPNRGSMPVVNSMMIFPSFPASTVGHVAIVTKVNNDGWIEVKHANFDKSETITTGAFKVDSKKQATYRTSTGVVWTTKYPVSHFVYRPN